MLFNDFLWSDIFLGHYLFSLFICVLAIIVTYFVSKKYKMPISFDKETKVTKENREINHQSSKLKAFDNDVSASLSTPVVKESPALLAEKVIEANMTEEQRKLEYEVRQQQLAQIHELMLKQSDKFGKISLSDVEEQMKLYQ